MKKYEFKNINFYIGQNAQENWDLFDKSLYINENYINDLNLKPIVPEKFARTSFAILTIAGEAELTIYFFENFNESFRLIFKRFLTNLLRQIKT